MAGIYLISPTNIYDRRRRILAEDAYVVRQRAIRRGDDFEGWQLSRSMRDVLCSEFNQGRGAPKYGLLGA